MQVEATDALELGHPLHTFDYDKIRDHSIVVRAAAKEQIKTLDGLERQLDPGVCVTRALTPSLPDALARTLGEHIGLGGSQPPESAATAVRRRVGDLCKECGQATLVYEEGCKKCLSCGFNEC